MLRREGDTHDERHDPAFVYRSPRRLGRQPPHGRDRPGRRPALTESESDTKTVEGGEVDHKELYGSQGREGMWLDATQAELDALLLDEPDGTVVDKRYVALRNRLNRMSEGLANDPLENSYEIIMRLWTPEEA